MDASPSKPRVANWLNPLLALGLVAIVMGLCESVQGATPEFVGVLATALDEAKTLQLTDAQRKHLLEVVDKAEAEAIELAMTLKDMPPAEREAKLAPFRHQVEARGLAILTLAQREKLMAMRGSEASPPASEPPKAEATETAPPPAPDAAPAETPPPVVPSPPVAAASTEPVAPIDSHGSSAIRFNFRYAPWKDVLDWFARQANLSLVTDNYPPGTFNYVDAREYTPAEAIDVLNSVLLTKGYTIIRRGRALMLINLEDGIPPNLVETLEPAELDDKGEFEVVSVLFNLDKLTPDEAEQEIKRLLGPQGKIVALPRSRQIQVTETAGRLRAIRSVISRVEDPQGSGSTRLKPFALKYASPSEALPVVRQLLDIPEGASASLDGSIRIAVDSANRRLLASGNADKLARLEQVIAFLDTPRAGQAGVGAIDDTPQLEVYAITSADSQGTLAVMQTLLAGLPEVRLAIDAKTGNLVALARPSEHATIRATLDQLQRDGRRVEVFQLRVLDPHVAVLSINKLFGGSTDPKAPSNPSAPQIDADPMTRQLLVRGSTAQIEQVRELLRKLGEVESGSAATGMASKVRILPLQGPAAQSALERLEAIWPSVRPNHIRVVTPSAVIPTLRPSSAPKSEPAGESTSPEPPPKPEASRTSSPEGPRNQTDDKTARRKVPVIFAAVATAPSEEEPAGPPADVVISVGPGGILIASDDIEALNDMEQLLNQLAGTATSSVSGLTVCYLKHAKADSVADTLEEVFNPSTKKSSEGQDNGLIGDIASAALGGSSGGGLVGSLLGLGQAGGFEPTGTIKVTADTRLNALIIRANSVDMVMIDELLTILDQKQSPEEILVAPKTRIIALVNTRADEVAKIVREVYSDRMVGANAGQANQQQPRQPSPQEMMQMLRGRRGGGGGGQEGGLMKEEDLQKMTVSTDVRTNSIIVAAPEPLFGDVQQFVAEIDAAAANDPGEAVRVVALHKASTQSVQRALSALVGDKVQFGTTPTPTTQQGGWRQRMQGFPGQGFQLPPGLFQNPGMTPQGGASQPSRSGSRSRSSSGRTSGNTRSGR